MTLFLRSLSVLSPAMRMIMPRSVGHSQSRSWCKVGRISLDWKVMRYLFLKILTPAFLVLSGAAMATEEAEYVLVQQDGGFELRDYAPQVVAETVVSGSFSRAGNSAFRP